MTELIMPEVGMGVTGTTVEGYKSYTVVKVFHARWIVIQEDRAIPDAPTGGYRPERDPKGEKLSLMLRKSGKWGKGGTLPGTFELGVRKVTLPYVPRRRKGRKKTNTKNLLVGFTPAIWKALEELAVEHKIAKAQVLRRGLRLLAWFEQKRAEGFKVIVVKKGEAPIEVKLPR